MFEELSTIHAVDCYKSCLIAATSTTLRKFLPRPRRRPRRPQRRLRRQNPRWRRLREKIRTFLSVFGRFRTFRTFSAVFGRFRQFSGFFGHFQPFWGVFPRFWTVLERFGSWFWPWKQPEETGISGDRYRETRLVGMGHSDAS